MNTFLKMLRIVIAESILPEGFFVERMTKARVVTLDKEEYRWLTKGVASGG